MGLDKLVYIPSVGTDAFYTADEKYIHQRLLKLYKLRHKLRDIQAPEWRLKSVNRVIRANKQRLSDLLDKSLEDNITRTLEESAVKDKNIINLFCSELTRALEIEPFQVSDKLIMVNVFFFQVLNSIIHNGFYYKGEKYIFYTASAGQIRTKRFLAVKESAFLKVQPRLFCGLTVDHINKLGGMNQNKFSSYLALTGSATDPWEDFDIHRAIVVDDFETNFMSDVDYIDYQTYGIERRTMEVNIPCTDGWGIVDGETTRMVRAPWIKGLLSNFPLQEYLKEKCTPDQWIVYDIWGTEHNVVKENIKYIFCKSQMKLHKFYSSWEEYCDNFEKYGSTVNYCNMEEEVIKDSPLSYQMLQQLDLTEKEIELITKKTNKDIEEIGHDYQTTMKLLGAVQSNQNPSYFQQSLMIYPELFKDYYCRDILKQTKKSLVKKAKGGKIKTRGKYLFVVPNPYSFCEWLFKGVINPEEGFAPDEVYTTQFHDGDELALLRSPSLGKEWGIRKNKRTPELDKWLGQTKCIYCSSYDTISKLLSFDSDGDRLLVVKDKILINAAKRSMQGCVPLYYEMKKATGGLINPDTMYSSMSVAYTAGNIGPVSNLITVVHNNGEEDREEALKVIKWLTMEVNFIIDGAKTLFFLTRPKEIDNIIKKHIKHGLPNFFIYAKDKLPSQVAEINNSTMNRISAAIVSPRIRFSKTIGKFDYRMLMNLDADFSVSPENEVVKRYDYWNTHLYLFNTQDGDGIKQEEMYAYRKIRQNIIEETGRDLDYITNTLVAVLYTTRNTSQKKTLWACFGDVIVENLKKNTVGLGNICPVCGGRFIPKRIDQVYCSPECYSAGRTHR